MWILQNIGKIIAGFSGIFVGFLIYIAFTNSLAVFSLLGVLLGIVCCVVPCIGVTLIVGFFGVFFFIN